MTYLEFYNQCLETGIMPEVGLCNALPYELKKEVFYMIVPTKTDAYELFSEKTSTIFWGAGLKSYDNKRFKHFTPIRQTLVLLMAAIAGEFDN